MSSPMKTMEKPMKREHPDGKTNENPWKIDTKLQNCVTLPKKPKKTKKKPKKRATLPKIPKNKGSGDPGGQGAWTPGTPFFVSPEHEWVFLFLFSKVNGCLFHGAKKKTHPFTFRRKKKKGGAPGWPGPLPPWLSRTLVFCFCFW